MLSTMRQRASEFGDRASLRRTKACGTSRAPVLRGMKSSVLIPVLVILTGCATTMRDVAREATPGVVEGGIDGAVDPQNQRKLAYGIDDELVAEATDRAMSGVVDGAMRSLEDPARREEVRKQVGELLKDVKLPLTIDGLSRSSMGDVVDESLARLTSEENRELLGKTFSISARELAKQATLGFQDAIDETRAKKDAGHLSDKEGNVLDAAARAAEDGPGYMMVASAGLGGFAAALIGAILLAARRARASRGELAQRDEALLALARAIKSTEAEPWSPALRRAIKKAIRDEEGGDYLRKLLRENRELRLADAEEPTSSKRWRAAPA